MTMTDNRTQGVTFQGAARPLLAGLLAIQAFLGYEWFMSGLSKLLSPDWVSGLGDNLTDTAKGLSGPYDSFLTGLVIPNAQLFAVLVMVGELAIGALLVAVAVLWWARWDRLGANRQSLLLAIVIGAGLLAIFLNVNFHLANNGGHPWLISGDPFDEGVDLDSVMPVIQLGISLVALRFLREVRAASRRVGELASGGAAPSRSVQGGPIAGAHTH